MASFNKRSASGRIYGSVTVCRNAAIADEYGNVLDYHREPIDGLKNLCIANSIGSLAIVGRGQYIDGIDHGVGCCIWPLRDSTIKDSYGGLYSFGYERTWLFDGEIAVILGYSKDQDDGTAICFVPRIQQLVVINRIILGELAS